MKAPDFTGERFIPGEGGAQIAYEHLHRYLFATRWAREKGVLDVACGSGYGAALLAKVADAVWAVELDQEAVSCARVSCSGSGVMFLRGDARDLPVHSSSIDLVVAFEILEHILDQGRLICEVARVLRPNGVALISTPNKAIYSDARKYVNPYHVRELYKEELLALLAPHFGIVKLLTQQVRAGSLILPEDHAGEGSEIIADLSPAPGRDSTEPMYFLALCGREWSFKPPPLASAYMDPSDYFLEEWLREFANLNREIETLGRWGQGLEEEVEKRDQVLSRVLAEVELRDTTIRELQAEMERGIASRDASLNSLRDEFDERTRWAKQLEEEVKDRDGKLRLTQDELDKAATYLARIRHAYLYRVLCRLGILPK